MESASFLVKKLGNVNTIKNTDSVYWEAYHLTANPVFQYSNATIDQLKSSGLLRLIRKKEVLDSIIDYDLEVRWVFRRVEAEGEIRPEYRQAISLLLNGEFLILIADKNYNNQPINLPFLSTTPETVNRVKGVAAQLHNMNGIIINNLKNLLKMRNSLAEKLRKEYHIK